MWQVVGKTRMNQWGSGALLTEGDLGDSAHGPLFAIAGNFAKNDRFDRRDPGRAQPRQHDQWGARLHLQVQGLRQRRRVQLPRVDALGPATWPGAEVQGQGVPRPGLVRLQGPRGRPGASFWELAARYSVIDPSDLARGDDKRTEIGGAFSYYYNKHNLKVQADFRQIEDEAANSGKGTKTKEFRLQTQFIF